MFLAWTHPPPFETKKRLKKRASTKSVFFRLLCPPGLQNASESVPRRGLRQLFFQIFLFLPNCDLERPSHGLATFIGFKRHFFSPLTMKNTRKTESCCTGGPGTHFSHVFTEKYSKYTPQKTTLFHFFNGLFSNFAADLSFWTLFEKVDPKTSKRTSKWHPF